QTLGPNADPAYGCEIVISFGELRLAESSLLFISPRNPPALSVGQGVSKFSGNKMKGVVEDSASRSWKRTFRTAAGEIEFLTDGDKVNTLEGWRETRI